MDAGLDSLGAVELKNAIAANLGVELPVTAAFDYPSVGAIAKYLASQVTAPADPELQDSATTPQHGPAYRHLAAKPKASASSRPHALRLQSQVMAAVQSVLGADIG
eukprot:808241-Pyramimonas_sp.AAC.1